MQRLRPSSLPQNPNETSTEQQNNSDQAHASYPTYYNSHYLQAYSQQPQPFFPSSGASSSNTSFVTQGSANRRRTNTFPSVTSSSSWYQPGNQRCAHPGCTFNGSHKSVELHMMDRHLIFPPGWDERKKKSDWDADPSLKGKPIPIQGTNVILNSPEVLEAWIAERKRRFPTSSHVEEKKRKMDEAVARGQLDVTDAVGGRANKRRKTEDLGASGHSKRIETGVQRHERPERPEKPFGHGRVPDSGWGARSKVKEPHPDPTTKPVVILPPSPSESDDDDSDEAPEPVSSKIALTVESKSAPELPINDEVVQIPPTKKNGSGNYKKSHPPQPKMPPRNPFASRPTLLRNLLSPEIRVTVSNLSQAIRFLVDNDFLRDVELKPGQAAEQDKIQVVNQEQQNLPGQ